MATKPTTSPADTSLNVDNVEEWTAVVIKKYNDKGMIADAMFWQVAVPLLKKAGETYN